MGRRVRRTECPELEHRRCGAGVREDRRSSRNGARAPIGVRCEGRRSSPHPLPAVPLPDEPRITPFTDLRLRLPRAVDGFLLPTDIAPAEFNLRPGKRPVDRKIRDFPHCVPALPAGVLAAPAPGFHPFSARCSRRCQPTWDVAGADFDFHLQDAVSRDRFQHSGFRTHPHAHSPRDRCRGVGASSAVIQY